eukprot:685142-Rhodomonas_salina.1
MLRQSRTSDSKCEGRYAMAGRDIALQPRRQTDTWQVLVCHHHLLVDGWDREDLGGACLTSVSSSEEGTRRTIKVILPSSGSGFRSCSKRHFLHARGLVARCDVSIGRRLARVKADSGGDL